MSMFVRSLSPWQQMQNWRIGQGNINSQQLGSLGAAADYSASFASAASNYYDSVGNLAARAALTRIQAKTAEARGQPLKGDAALAAAKAAGAAILNNLGLPGGSSTASTSSSSSSSKNYKAPINPATGYSYVGTSTSGTSALSAVNFVI
jgi:hypothetical protein